MYTIQKYLETNVAASVLCFSLSPGRGSSLRGTVFKAEESQRFAASSGKHTALGNPHYLQTELDTRGRSGFGERCLH